MSDFDDIRKRLDKLKESENSSTKVTDKDLEIRLAKLKNLDIKKNYKIEYSLIPKKFNSEVEEVDNLLAELNDEVKILEKVKKNENKDDQISEISKLHINDEIDESFNLEKIDYKKLNKEVIDLKNDLKLNYDFDKKTKENLNKKISKKIQIQNDSSDENEDYLKVVDKYINEPKLSDNISSDDSINKIDSCNFCFKPAKVICSECNEDVFCLDCLKEFHDDDDFKKHKFKKYISELN